MTVAKQGAKTVVPRLRFPEFRDAQAWDQLSLEELEKRDWVELGRGNVISASDMKDVPGEYPVYSSSIKNDGYMGSYGQFMFDEELISWSVDGGGNFFHRPRHKFSVTNVSGYMRLKTDRLLYRFVASQLQLLHAAQKFDYQLKAHPSVIRKLYRLGLPSPAEQQKIADCLTSLDEVIAAQGRKVEALKAHKRGLMQQLFPREGETRPHLRFPEFRNASEWKEERLGDSMPFVTSGSRGWAAYYAKAGSLFVRITNLSRASIFLDLDDQKFVTLPPEATEGVRTQLQADDVLISITADTGIIGYVDPSVPSPAYINQHIALVRFDGAKISGKFVAYLLSAEVSQRQFRGATDSGAKAGMNLVAVQNLKLFLPLLKEQQRIADCLSSIDTQITAESHQLAALKTHKQGLMQQLFPAPESV